MNRQSKRLTGKSLFGSGLVLLLMVVETALTQTIPGFNPGASQQSLSRQFTVHGGGKTPGSLQDMAVPRGPGGQPLALWLARVPPPTAGDSITLNPQLAAVSAERIKAAILRILKKQDQWRGQIHIYLASPRKWKGATEIRPIPFRDGWRYGVIIPEEIEWQRFVRTIAGAVLLELVNRGDAQNFIEPPLWLTEGMAELLVVEPGRALVLEADRTYTSSNSRSDLSKEARMLLKGQTVMDWTELSNANASSLSDENEYSRFKGSAVLLTDLLLVQPGGQEKMGRFVDSLGSVLNWQTAFLKAYQADYRTLLDVEKWWAVVDAANAINGSSGLWPRDIVMAHLSEIFTETVGPKEGHAEGVGRKSINLSQLIVVWDFAAQREVVDRKMEQLRQLLAHSDRNLAPLVEDTYRLLNQYVDDRTNAGRDPEKRSELEARGKLLAQTAARRLTMISQKIATFRP